MPPPSIPPRAVQPSHEAIKKSMEALIHQQATQALAARGSPQTRPKNERKSFEANTKPNKAKDSKAKALNSRPRRRTIPPDGLLYAPSPVQLQAAQALVVMGGECNQLEEGDRKVAAKKQTNKGGGKSVKVKSSTKQKPYERKQAKKKSKAEQIKQTQNPVKENSIKSAKGMTSSNGDKREALWDAQYTKLQAYKAQYGNCRVPKCYPTDPSLGRWVSACVNFSEWIDLNNFPHPFTQLFTQVNYQRYIYGKNEIDPTRMLRLESIDFEWKLQKLSKGDSNKCDKTEQMNEIQSNDEENADANQSDGKLVSQIQVKKGGGKSAKAKCSTEKTPYEQNQANEKAKPAQIKQIHNTEHFNPHESKEEETADASTSPESEEVVLTKRGKKWEAKFEELLEFKKNHGHVNVPWRWKDNRDLSSWCSYQRKKYKELAEGHSNGLTAEQIDRLNEIGELYA